jgi:GNAT superfamily N-acetyltransferase
MVDLGSDQRSGEPNLTLRPAVEKDTALVLRFIGKKAEFDGVSGSVMATEGKLHEALFGDPPLAHVVLAEIDGRAIGFASYFFTYSTPLARAGIWIDDLYVDADLRSQGVGRALLVHIARLAKARGCGRVEWTVAVANERGLAFYRGNGASVREHSRLCRLDAAAIDRIAQDRDSLASG